MPYNFENWVGVVTDNVDPEMRGRVQVRIFGIHTLSPEENENYPGQVLPTLSLPWATCLMPPIYGGVSGDTCPPPAVKPGAYVYGISTDGDEYQNLIVIGILNSPISEEAQGNGTGLSDTDTTSETTADNCFDLIYNAVVKMETSTGLISAGQRLRDIYVELKTSDPTAAELMKSSSGIDLDIETSESIEPLAKGYLKMCINKMGSNKLAGLYAYAAGLKGAEQGFNSYGDPRKGELSFQQLIDSLKNNKNEESSKYATFLEGVVNELGTSNAERCLNGTLGSAGAILTGVSPDGKHVFPVNIDKYVLNTAFHIDGKHHEGSSHANHFGVDIHTGKNATLQAMCNGIVVEAGGGDCNPILIKQEDGYYARYAHCASISVSKRQQVTMGQPIGIAGSTGCTQVHLHLEISVDDGHSGAWGTNGKYRKYYSITDQTIIQTIRSWNTHLVDPESYFNHYGIKVYHKSSIWPQY